MSAPYRFWNAHKKARRGGLVCILMQLGY